MFKVSYFLKRAHDVYYLVRCRVLPIKSHHFFLLSQAPFASYALYLRLSQNFYNKFESVTMVGITFVDDTQSSSIFDTHLRCFLSANKENVKVVGNCRLHDTITYISNFRKRLL